MNQICICACAAILSAALPAAAGGLGAEVLLPADGRHAYEPAAAFGDGKYLVVWRAGWNEEADILALRVGTDGRPLDERPIVVCAAADCQEQPRVAFGGGVFLVAWADLRGGKDYDLYAARVTAEGVVQDKDGNALCAEARNQVRPAVAFDGERFLVAWEDARNGTWPQVGNVYQVGHMYETWATTVSTDGKAADAKGAAALAGDTYEWPALAAGPDRRMLVVTEKGSGFYAGRPLTGKQVLHHDLRGGRVLTPAVASSGTNWLLAAGNFRPIGRGAGIGEPAYLIDAEGKATAVQVSGRTKSQRMMFPAVAWDGAAYVVAWSMPQTDGRANRRWEAVSVSRLSRDGKVLEDSLPVGGTAESPARRPAVASDGKGNTLIAFERHPATSDALIRVGVRMLRSDGQ